MQRAKDYGLCPVLRSFFKNKKKAELKGRVDEKKEFARGLKKIGIPVGKIS